jgi:hypothetical protein
VPQSMADSSLGVNSGNINLAESANREKKILLKSGMFSPHILMVGQSPRQRADIDNRESISQQRELQTVPTERVADSANREGSRQCQQREWQTVPTERVADSANRENGRQGQQKEWQTGPRHNGRLPREGEWQTVSTVSGRERPSSQLSWQI